MSISFLIVEDEVLTARFVQETIVREEHRVAGIAKSADEARSILEKTVVDCILLDINICGQEDGLQFAQSIAGHPIAIVFISAYSDKAIRDEASGILPYGFLVKPFDENDLLAMISVVASRLKSERTALADALEYEMPNDDECIKLDHTMRRIICKDRSIPLSKNEFTCIDYLLQYRDVIVGYDDLKNRVWDEKEVREATLRELINRIRKKVPCLSITNVYGQGYVCSVSENLFS